MKDYYDILGIPRSASQEDIKRAYRILAQQFHPDKNGGNDRRFKDVSEAYRVLSGERTKAEYDAKFDKGFAGDNSDGERMRAPISHKESAAGFTRWIARGGWILILIAISLVIAVLYGSDSTQSSNSADSNVVQQNTTVKATTVQVSEFYNGLDGYSLAIPTGNTSTCIWTWDGGNADIPYTQTTEANTATEKHTITFPAGALDSGSLYNFKVSCVDDWGDQYTGVFPSQSP